MLAIDCRPFWNVYVISRLFLPPRNYKIITFLGARSGRQFGHRFRLWPVTAGGRSTKKSRPPAQEAPFEQGNVRAAAVQVRTEVQCQERHQLGLSFCATNILAKIPSGALVNYGVLKTEPG
jgi:hypothetical protein